MNKKAKSRMVVVLLLGVFIVLAILKSGNSQEQIALEPSEEPRWLLFHARACVACKEMMALSSSLEDEYRGQVEFMHIPLDDLMYDQIVRQYQVNFIPTSVFEVEGEEMMTRIGAIPEEELRATLDKMVKENE